MANRTNMEESEMIQTTEITTKFKKVDKKEKPFKRGKLIIYCINKDKKNDYQTTKSYNCFETEITDIIATLRSKDKVTIKNAYFNSKPIKI
jgi:hypothetical protein